MKGSALNYAAAAAACATIVACAPAPVVSNAEPPPTRVIASSAPVSYRSSAIARHARLATSARDAGDLAAAADHEEVLVLLAPDDPARRKTLQTTRDAIRKSARGHADNGIAARRAGDLAVARDAFLHVLVLDPDNADAAKALREIDLATMSKSQGDRAARARVTDDIVASVKARASDSYDLDQRLELMRAGDLTAGLRELKTWVDANPGDRASRQKIGVAVADKARDAEGKGQRETALGLYEQASTLAGAGAPDWALRIQALRKALGEQYYAEGMKVSRKDLAAAIRHWENGARYDPSNTNLQLRLREGKLAQQKLQRIEK